MMQHLSLYDLHNEYIVNCVIISVTHNRVRNEKIDCHRFSGMATQCVELLGTDIERIDIEALSISFLQEKIKRYKN